MSANEVATTATSSEVTLSVVMVTILILLVVCNLFMYTVTRMLTDPKFCLRQMVQRYTQKVPRVRVLEVHPKPRTPSLIGHSHADLISLLSHSANLQPEGVPRETYSPTLQLENSTREIIHSSLLQEEGITREITPVYTKDDEWEAAKIDMTITCDMQKVEFIQEEVGKQVKSDPNVITDTQHTTDSTLQVPLSRKRKEIEQPIQEKKQKENGPILTQTVPFPSKTVNKDKVQGKMANKDNRSISKGDNSRPTPYSDSASSKRTPATGKVGGVRPGRQMSRQNMMESNLTNMKQENVVNGNQEIEGHTDSVNGKSISVGELPVVQDNGVNTLYTVQSQETAAKDTTSIVSKDTTLTASKDTTSTMSKDTTLITSKDTTLTASKDTTLTASKDTTLTASKDTTLTVSKDTTLITSKDTTLTASKETTLTASKDTTLTASKDTTSAVLRSDTVPGGTSAQNMDTRVGNNSHFNSELGTTSSSNNDPGTPPASYIELQTTNGSNIGHKTVAGSNIKNGTSSDSEIGQILLTNTYDTPVIKFFKEMKNENIETADEMIYDGRVTEESEMTDGQTNKQDYKECDKNQNLSEVNTNSRGNGATDSEVEITDGQIVEANGMDEQGVKEIGCITAISETEAKDRHIYEEQTDEESPNRTESVGQNLVDAAVGKQTTGASEVTDSDDDIKTAVTNTFDRIETDLTQNTEGTRIKSGFDEQNGESDNSGERDKISEESNEGETSLNTDNEKDVDMTTNDDQTMTQEIEKKDKVHLPSESDSKIKTEKEMKEEELKVLHKTDSEKIMKGVLNIEDSKPSEESDVEKDLTEYIRSNTMETNDDVSDKKDEKVVKEKDKRDRVSSLKGAKPVKNSKSSKQEAVTTKTQAVRARNQATVRNGKRFQQLKLTK